MLLPNTRRQRQAEEGIRKRSWLIDQINIQGADFLKARFARADVIEKKSKAPQHVGQSILAWSIKDPEQSVLIEVRVAKSAQAFTNSYFKGARSKEENLALIKDRLFLLLSNNLYSLIPGYLITNAPKHFAAAQLTQKGNETRLNLNFSNWLPDRHIRTGNLLYPNNLAVNIYHHLKTSTV